MPPLAANLIGWLVAFAVSFAGHYRLTFRHSKNPLDSSSASFLPCVSRRFAINEASYAWLLHSTAIRYDILLALILAGLAVATFIASRLWAFRHKPAA